MDGYCMFNHVAVAARYAQVKHRIQRSAASSRAGVMGGGTGWCSLVWALPQMQLDPLVQCPILFPSQGPYCGLGCAPWSRNTVHL